MKTLGLIGGFSWVSTVDYYQLINQGVNERLGGLNFSECIVYSFNYADIVENNNANDWESTFQLVAKAGLQLKNAGAAAIVLCANTVHLIADRLEKKIGLPLIHIATATARTIAETGIKKVGLLGTKFTMELDFFTSKLKDKHIEAIIPGPDDREFIQQSIYHELGKGILKPETKARYLAIIDQLIGEGAEGIILGCTEIPLLIQESDLTVPAFNTTAIHARAAVEFALK